MVYHHRPKHFVWRAAAFATCTLFGALTVAQSAEPISPKLTPKLQSLLRKEMIAVHEASQDIFTALIEGNNGRVAELSQNIHDSFILKQAMTPGDKADLIAAVPAQFVKTDRAFHALAAELAQAARNNDRAKQSATFGKMITACSSCHAQYATDRFPQFAK